MKELELTSTLIPTQNPPSKELPFGINHLAHLLRVSSRSHRVNVHFVEFRELFEEGWETRSG